MTGHEQERGEIQPTSAEGVYRLEFGVPWPPRHVAAYLVDGERPVLVDTGGPSDAGTDWSTTLGKVGLEPRDLAAVVVTHPHSDHIGKAPELLDAGVPVLAPDPALDQLSRDVETLAGGVREVGTKAGLRGEEIENAVEDATSSLVRNRRLLPPDSPRVHGVDYAEFEAAGRTFEAVRTPGHQIHHASYLTDVAGKRVLFSGDALVESFRPAALHTGIDHGAFDAVDAFYDAMDTFDELAADVVLPGHGPEFTDLTGVVDSTRESLDALLGETAAALGDVAPATALEVTEHRVGGMKYPAQLLDVVGALGTLETRGEVRYRTEDGARIYEPV